MSSRLCPVYTVSSRVVVQILKMHETNYIVGISMSCLLDVAVTHYEGWHYRIFNQS